MGITNGTFDEDLSGWQSNEKVYWENGYAKFNECGPVRAYMSQRFVIDNPILSFDWATANNLCCPPGCQGYSAFILELVIHDIVGGIPVDTTVISEVFPFVQGGGTGGTKIKDVSQYLGKDATLQFRDYESGYCCRTGWYTMTIDNVILSPNWGTLRVSSVPGGANIDVDGSFLNLTPETGSIDLTGISPGTHTVKITKTDYYDSTVTVDVLPGRIYEIAAALIKQIGCLSFLSDPAGAKIFLSDRNGQVLNDTEFVTFERICDLLWGDYKWKLLLDGYYPEEGTVTLDTSAGVAITKTLTQIGIGCIYFTSNPAGAKIFVDNGDTGKFTPDTVCELSLGSHHYELVLTGYLPASGDITLVSTRGGSVSLDLCTPWQCEPGQTGYEIDGCGNRRANPACTPANVISATLTVDTNDCVAPCIVNGTVSWTNTGGTASSPTDLSITVNGTPIPIDSAVVIGPGETTTVYLFTISNLAAGTYTVQAFPNAGTIPQITTVANIVATSISAIPRVLPCVQSCTVDVSVAWINNGDTEGSFIPSIKVDGIPISPAQYTSETLAPGATVTRTFVTDVLAVGSHQICADPNGTCATITVEQVVQAGFGAAGMIIVTGLVIGALYAATKKP